MPCVIVLNLLVVTKVMSRLLIPYYYQESEWTCGAACLRMALMACTIKRTERQVVKLLCCTRRWGTSNSMFSVVCDQFALNYTVERLSSLRRLKALVRDKYIVIVNYYLRSEHAYHFAIVRSISLRTITLIDPIMGPKFTLPCELFLKDWRGSHSVDRRWFIAIKSPVCS